MAEQDLAIGAEVETDAGGLRIEGTIKDIKLAQSKTGWAPVVTVVVSRRGEETVSEVVTSAASIWRSKGAPPSEVCGACGRIHKDDLFTSPDLLESVRKFSGASPEERHDLLIDIASLFVELLHDSNCEISEEMHSLVHDVNEGVKALEQAWMRLGRTVVNVVLQVDSHSQHEAAGRMMIMGIRRIPGQDQGPGSSAPPTGLN